MIKKLTIGTLSVLGAFYLDNLLLFSFTDCQRLVVSQINSPDGKYEVSYYQEICESKPQEVTVWLGESGSSTKRLMFSAIVTTTEKLNITWQTNFDLLITYPEALEPITIDVNYEHLRIKYKRAS